ncbi:MAG: biosynthetic peptidoglycan transglycosylase [Pseudomonadales bacterium]
MRSLIIDLNKVLKVVDDCDLVPSDGFIRALIVAEDRRFFFHVGFDAISIIRAAYMTICLGRLQGASTIEAQLVRTVTGRTEISFSRKVREVLISTLVSLMRSKRRIASAYLSVAYFGFSRRGLAYAAIRLGAPIESCADEQIFFLIAMLKRPLSQSGAKSNLAAIERRAAWIARKF